MLDPLDQFMRSVRSMRSKEGFIALETSAYDLLEVKLHLRMVRLVAEHWTRPLTLNTPVITVFKHSSSILQVSPSHYFS